MENINPGAYFRNFTVCALRCYHLYYTFAVAREPKAYTAILAGMDEWVRKTCISFKKRTTETDYAYFTDAGSG